MFASLLCEITLDAPLLNMATVLICGIVGGELFARIRLPKVTGWIATGILLRQLKLPGLNAEMPGLGGAKNQLGNFDSFNYLVLGYIAFTVGATLYIANLRNTQKRIGFIMLTEALITPFVVGLIMLFIAPLVSPLDPKAALLLAAIAIAGAPGTTVLVIQEARARGILTRTLVAAVGLIDMVAVGVFVFVSSFLAKDTNWVDSLTSVGIQFGVTLAIGFGCVAIALLLIRVIVSPAFLGPTMVAVILGSWGAAAGYGTSGGILACTFAGIALTNLRHDIVRSSEAYLHAIGGVLFALFFTFAGMKLDFTKVPEAAGLVAVYFIARVIGKSLSAYTAMSLAGAPQKVRKFMGLSLLPHGGVAVGLILLVQQAEGLAAYSEIVTTVGLSALAINQLIGPSATRLCLQKAGEDHKDRPRLLDFLQEHRIVTGMSADSAEEVVRKLTSQLYATSEIDIPRDEFIERVLKRHDTETTCFGEGLMIPHAVIEQGDEVKGVLGISSAGIDIDTPDDRPIHAILLLVTPVNERNRHLEVLAAFARAITRDVNLREQLYHARSAAHAYDVIHADEAEDMNYFLEDVIEQYSEHKE